MEMEEIQSPTAEEGEIEDTCTDDQNASRTAIRSASDNPNINACTVMQHHRPETDDELIFKVTFNNKSIYDKYNELLLESLQSTFSVEKFHFSSMPNISTIVARKQIESKDDERPESNLFLIDTSPAVKLNAAQVPSYRRSITEVLDESTPQRRQLLAEAANKCSRPKAQNNCFNCGDADHSLRECRKPRNNARIQRARTRKTERYHVDVEQRFAHIRPGRISTKTRHAMGFSRGELPFMFYRMREIGYPPAWLEEAKVQSSGMALFNADGSEVLRSDEEDGESDGFKYDVNKIVDFPGFNVHPGEKFYDDYKHHNVPRFQDQDLKENFIKSLGENIIKGYKRKKLKNLPDPDEVVVESTTNLDVHDMEMEDSADETAEPPAFPRPLSPTLEELQAQQTQLMEQLESNTTVESINKSANTTNCDAVAVEENESLPNTSSSSSIPPPSTPTKLSSSFKASYGGTPILKFSVYDKLPTGDNFKVGVSDVINFENLPDSTGKYEQMKGLLKNVRNTMKKLYNDDDDDV